jgi:hypothetical protein
LCHNRRTFRYFTENIEENHEIAESEVPVWRSIFETKYLPVTGLELYPYTNLLDGPVVSKLLITY